MSVLAGWFREARAEGDSEQQAVRRIAARLGETEVEARRVLVQVGRVNLKGGVRRSASAARPAAAVSGNGQRPGLAQLDESAVADYYRVGRLTLAPDHALRACAKRFGARPHDLRPIVNAVERELQDREA
jgi:hypothetical protein